LSGGIQPKPWGQLSSRNRSGQSHLFDLTDYVLPERHQKGGLCTSNHRIILNEEAEADGIKTKDFIEAHSRKVPIAKAQVAAPNMPCGFCLIFFIAILVRVWV